jgi:hypothetical protein
MKNHTRLSKEAKSKSSPAYDNYMHMQQLQQQLAARHQAVSRSLHDIYEGQIIRLAAIWLSRTPCRENIHFHYRVSEIQCTVIRAQTKLKTKTI